MKETNNLEATFEDNLREWEAHALSCLHYSNTQPMLNCDAYKNIVSMGAPALLLLKRLYDKDSSTNYGLDSIKAFGIIPAVRSIVGKDNFSIPESIRGDISAMKCYTKHWLNKNIKNYLTR